jgi:hypothetical protein
MHAPVLQPRPSSFPSEPTVSLLLLLLLLLPRQWLFFSRCAWNRLSYLRDE